MGLTPINIYVGVFAYVAYECLLYPNDSNTTPRTSRGGLDSRVDLMCGLCHTESACGGIIWFMNVHVGTLPK